MFKLVLSIFTISLCVSSIKGQARENDPCRGGICKKLSDCKTGQKGIKSGNRPEICTFIGLEPVVCCQTQVQQAQPKPVETAVVQPLSSAVSNTQISKARQKCTEYSRYVYREEVIGVLPGFGTPAPKKFDECPINHETLIVGGVDAKPKEFPHMAHIGYGGKNGSRISWNCGGSLISERYVLSAAHCTKHSSKGPASWARIGDLNIATEDDDAKPVTIAIVERIDHPDYNGVQLYNDIALYKLEKDVPLSPYLRPICLDIEEKQTDTALACGWGHTDWGGEPSDTLKKVLLKRVDLGECNNSYARSVGKQLPNGILSTSMMCAGNETDKDTCRGDSGGPLQITTKIPYCMYYQIGVTSFGKACGQGIPGIYTKVSHFVPWIESIVWP